jgi:hypothetical protein
MQQEHITINELASIGQAIIKQLFSFQSLADGKCKQCKKLSISVLNLIADRSTVGTDVFLPPMRRFLDEYNDISTT